MDPRFRTFREFYPFYLSQHVNPACRRLHVFGILSVVLLLAVSLVARKWGLLALLPLAGYGPAWVGHYFFEKNRPATFSYPLFSLAGDWVMFAEILTGKIKF
jgi:Predicted membrane protein